MPATLVCPHCRGAVTVPDELMGGGVTCPHCRGVFAAALPLPPSPPAPPRAKPVKTDPFAFDDGPADHDDEDDEPRPRKRPKPEPKFEWTGGAVVVLILTGLAAVVLAIVRNELPRPVGGGFDVPRMVVSGLIGGVAAGGVGLARYLGTSGGQTRYSRRR